MAGRRRIEDHMVVGRRPVGIAQQQGELVEGGDFDRAGARETLLQQGDFLLRQHASIGGNGPLAVIEGRLLRVDVHRVDTR